MQDKITAEFHFSKDVAKIAEFRCHKDTGILNLYLSDTKVLFEGREGSLNLGTVEVQVLDKDQYYAKYAHPFCNNEK